MTLTNTLEKLAFDAMLVYFVERSQKMDKRELQETHRHLRMWNQTVTQTIDTLKSCQAPMPNLEQKETSNLAQCSPERRFQFLTDTLYNIFTQDVWTHPELRHRVQKDVELRYDCTSKSYGQVYLSLVSEMRNSLVEASG